MFNNTVFRDINYFAKFAYNIKVFITLHEF